MNIEENYDLIIVGGGPAGLSAAIYAARYKLKTLIISEIMGGLAARAHIVCNYPSYTEIKGHELMQRFIEHVKSLDVPLKYEKINNIEKKRKGFILTTDKSNYSCKKLIFSGGTERIKLGVPGENKFYGKGVSYCATCDAAFFKDKKTAVIGGGNAALTAALLLSEYAKKVYIIYRKNNFFRGDRVWTDAVLKNKKIEPIYSEEIKSIEGEKKLEYVLLKSGKKLRTDGVFIEIGSTPKFELIKKLGVRTNKQGYIKTKRDQKTNVEGLYAAGDVTDSELKQIITASAQGTVAAFSAYHDLIADQSKIQAKLM